MERCEFKTMMFVMKEIVIELLDVQKTACKAPSRSPRCQTKNQKSPTRDKKIRKQNPEGQEKNCER